MKLPSSKLTKEPSTQCWQKFFLWQCPPFRLSYQGLGEPLCFAAFGPFATSAFYLSQGSKRLSGCLSKLHVFYVLIGMSTSLSENLWFTSDMCTLPVTSTILSASLLVGMTTSLILFCSHFHQVCSFFLLRPFIMWLFSMFKLVSTNKIENSSGWWRPSCRKDVPSGKILKCIP